VQELSTYGITVFVLYGCDIPDDYGKDVGDGFDKLVEKLHNDLGNSIKFIEEVDVTIKGVDTETGKITNTAIREDISSFGDLGDNQIYYISTDLDASRVTQQLSESAVVKYVLEA
jgi:hypothetical protein